MPPITIRAVGIPWYREEDWPRLLEVMEDRHLLPDSFAAWRRKAEDMQKKLKAAGAIAERVELKPDEFVVWCRARGLNVDAHARNQFASEFVARKYLNRS